MNHHLPTLNRICRTTLLLLCIALISPVYSQERQESVGRPSVSKTVLRIARSEDGKTFTDTGEIFLQHASGADIVRLANGSLLVMVDYARENVGHELESVSSREQTILAVAKSKDGGRTWSSLEPIEIRGPGTRSIRPRHGDLVKLPGGWHRLFFATPAMVRRDGRLSRSREITTIRSALTRNCTDYKLEPRNPVRLQFKDDVHPMAGWIGKRLHVFAAEQTHQLRDKNHTASQIHHLLSRDGKKFVRLAPSRVRNVSFVGSVIMTTSGARAYGSEKNNIVSLVTDRGREWKREPGVCLKKGWDPAVVELKDRSFLMIYSQAMTEKSSASSQMVSVDPDWLFDQYVWLTTEDEIDVEDSLADAENEEPIDPELDVEQIVAVDSASQEVRSMDSAESEDEQQQVVLPMFDWSDWDPMMSDGFVPQPDFEHKMNYKDWFREYAVNVPDENAYDVYASFMEEVGDEPGSKPDWPKLNDMNNGNTSDDPPGPWKPEDHPDWEESFQNAQWHLDQYRKASRIDEYATPYKTGPPVNDDGDDVDSDTANLLIGMMLPNLSQHRAMAKATLAHSWRTDENGKVSADKMLDAWETILRSATHLESGATLIEDLVAAAERNIVQQNARWALKHGIFNEDELVAALNTLQRFDRSEEGPTQSLRGEHAMAMDLTEYIFSPPGPDGLPKVNRKRAEQTMNWMMDSDSKEQVDQVSQMGPEDAYATAEALDLHYRELAEQMSIGYPEVRASDIAAFEKKRVNTTALTKAIMPALSRVYNLQARSETSRRATQLAYAIHIYKARNGRWPESVAELGGEFGDTMKIDPFTGDYFGYQLTGDGPKIYSRSENGMDDGGIHSPSWDRNITNDAGSDDFVFWPPQKR